jgi:alkylation response protein AidB-like acyl-CoA dehydrogenase
MDLGLTAEQQELREAVGRFCREQITAERLAAWQGLPHGIDEGCWKAIAGLGWFGLGIPESSGGSGLGLGDVAFLLQEAASGLVPRAVSGAVRGGFALARLAPGAPELAAAARGERMVTLALDEEDCRAPERYATRVTNGREGPRVDGAKAYVPNALQADYQIVAARDGNRPCLVLVARESTRVAALRTFDGEEQAMVRYEGSTVLRRLGGADAGGALDDLRREQIALALAEMVGGMQAVLDMTVNYVKEREQFGQKIGAFQAVQHQVADMATTFTAGRHLAWQAITRLAAGTASGTELAAAAAYVGQGFKRLTFTAHHLHGGAGYVIEHPLHYHSERAQALCIRWTPEAAALGEVAADLLD